MRRALVVASLVAVAAAVVSLASAASTIRYPIPGAGASIAVPASWKAVDARTATNSARFKQFVEQNPSLRPFISQISGPGSVVKLIALDPKLDGSFATNVNVVVTSAPGGISLKAIAAIYGEQLKSLVPTLQGNVTTAVVSLPAGKAVRATYRLGFIVGARTFVVQTLQYLFLHANKSIVVTLSTLPSRVAARSATFMAIARSLRFG